MWLLSRIVPDRNRPPGTITVPPPTAAQASIARWNGDRVDRRAIALRAVRHDIASARCRHCAGPSIAGRNQSPSPSANERGMLSPSTLSFVANGRRFRRWMVAVSKRRASPAITGDDAIMVAGAARDAEMPQAMGVAFATVTTLVFRLGVHHLDDRSAGRGGQSHIYADDARSAAQHLCLLHRVRLRLDSGGHPRAPHRQGHGDPDRARDDDRGLLRHPLGRRYGALSGRAGRLVPAGQRHHHSSGRRQPVVGDAGASGAQSFSPELQPSVQFARHRTRSADRCQTAVAGGRNSPRRNARRRCPVERAECDQHQLYLDLRF